VNALVSIVGNGNKAQQIAENLLKGLPAGSKPTVIAAPSASQKHYSSSRVKIKSLNLIPANLF